MLFHERNCSKTKAMALAVIKHSASFPKNTAYFVMGKQLIRSATSVAANFRAAARARSEREYYAKLCIVVEETDETLFWLEMLRDSGIDEINEKNKELSLLATEILKIMSTTRKNLKQRLKK